MLETQNLQFSYKGSKPLTFPDMHCGKGEQWLLLGQSGSGKTTLLHLLGGLLTPQHGSLIIGDTDILSSKPLPWTNLEDNTSALFFKRRILSRHLLLKKI